MKVFLDKLLNIRTSPPNSCLPHTADLAKLSPSSLQAPFFIPN